MSLRTSLFVTTIFIVLLPLSVTVATWYGLLRMDTEIERVAEEYEESRSLQPVEGNLSVALVVQKHASNVSAPDARAALARAEVSLLAYLADQFDSEASDEHQATESGHARDVLTDLRTLIGTDWDALSADERLRRTESIRDGVRALYDDADEGVIDAQHEARRIERRTMRTVLIVSMLSALSCVAVATLSNRRVIRGVRDLHRSVALRADREERPEPRDVTVAVSEIGELNERLYLQLQEKSRELLRRERVAGIGLLAADVAHEINNPVNAVLGLTELSLRTTGQGPIDDDARSELHDSLTIIRREAVRCKEIVERLMAMVRARSEPTSFDATRLLVETVEIARASRPDKAACYHVLRSAHAVPVVSRAQEVRQIMLTLLINAADAIGDDGRIEVDVTTTDDEVWLRVRDNGRGFTAETQKGFSIAFQTTRAEEGGLGLGLSIAHTLAADLGAELRSFSDGPGTGSLFLLALPLTETTHD